MQNPTFDIDTEKVTCTEDSCVQDEVEVTVADVVIDSVAYQAGFEAGCRICSVNGNVIHDAIDWRWYTSEDVIDIEYVDLDDERGVICLKRDMGQDWGFVFDSIIFDDVKTCKNGCIFCFMNQLAPDMRDTLHIKDDDFRLSFMSGTFVTLTNVTNKDLERIVEQKISPLRVSLHAIEPSVRKSLMGKNEHVGLDAIKRLLSCGIEMDVQIVLVPDINDGKHLDKTLSWALSQPEIKTVAIVPLGYTKFQNRFTYGFEERDRALSVVEQVQKFQEKAFVERGHAWVYAADEFYRNAYGKDVLKHLPDEAFYNGYEMFEDGIGMIRSSVEDFKDMVESGLDAECAQALDEKGLFGCIISGEAMLDYFPDLINRSALANSLTVVAVENRYFGGNINVTGLLSGCDMARAIREHSEDVDISCRAHRIYFCFDVLFNADGLTLDGMTLDDLREESGCDIYVISSNPLDYIEQITRIAKEM